MITPYIFVLVLRKIVSHFSSIEYLSYRNKLNFEAKLRHNKQQYLSKDFNNVRRDVALVLWPHKIFSIILFAGFSRIFMALAALKAT